MPEPARGYDGPEAQVRSADEPEGISPAARSSRGSQHRLLLGNGLQARRPAPARTRTTRARPCTRPARPYAAWPSRYARRWPRAPPLAAARRAATGLNRNSMALAPVVIGIKQSRVPMAFQATDKNDFTGYTDDLARTLTVRRRRQRIRWIENKKDSGVLSSKAPSVPLDMFQFPVCRGRLCQNLGLVYV